MGGGAWWASVYGVAQSRTRLKRLSSSSSSRAGGEAGGTKGLVGAKFLFCKIEKGLESECRIM